MVNNFLVSVGFSDSQERFCKSAPFSTFDTGLLSDMEECIDEFTLISNAEISIGEKSVQSVTLCDGALYVYGDFLGRVPIYFYSQNNLFGKRLLVATALRCFYDLPYREVHRLPSGTYLRYFNGALSIGTYYSVPRAVTEISDAAALTKTRTLLTAAVERLSRVSSRPCVFLSGGVDSTVVCAIAKQFLPNIEAFTFSVGDKKGDLHYARLAAEHIGVPLHEVIVTRNDVFDALDTIIALNEDSNWTQITSAVGQYFLSKAASEKGFTAALCGDLSDEIYASYPQIKRWSWRDEQYIEARSKLIEKCWINPVRAAKVLGAFGIQYLDPFTDQDFIEFASTTPARFKDGEVLGKKVDKPLLRSAFADLIPTEIVTRAKGCQGEVTHVDEFMADYKELIKERFDSMFNDKGGIIQNVKIDLR